MASYASKLALLLSISLFALNFCFFHVESLDVGLRLDTGLSLGKECSRKCESEFCKVAPFLRYGKYCGLLYSGCPGETPCDGLDACCMRHDACIQSKNNDYLNTKCNRDLLNCLSAFKKSKAKSFKGNTCSIDDVTKIISETMEAALLAGRYLHRP